MKARLLVFLAVVVSAACAQDNRLSVVVVADGFTAEEMESKFTPAYERFKGAFLATDPMKDFPDAFVFKAFKSPASASGVSERTGVRTASIAYFNNLYSKIEKNFPLLSKNTGSLTVVDKTDPQSPYFRFKYADVEDARASVRKVIGSYPTDSVVLMANTTAYGGGSISFNKGPGTDWGLLTQPLVVNTPGTTVPPHDSVECPDYTNKESLDYSYVALHELGHALWDLGDEYIVKGKGKYSKTGEGFPANASPTGDPGTVKWKKWIGKAGVGNPVLGGLEWEDGVWHPTAKCKMGDTGCRFCAICKERVVTRIFQQVSFIDGATPSEAELVEPAPRDIPFSIQTLGSVRGKVMIEWWVNGKLTPGTGSDGASFTLPASQLRRGSNVVVAIVSSRKFLVDPSVPQSGFTLPNHRRWKITVAGNGVPNGLTQRQPAQ